MTNITCPWCETPGMALGTLVNFPCGSSVGRRQRQSGLCKQIEALRVELEKYKRCWELLHEAASDMAKLAENVTDMMDEEGEPFWSPELDHLLTRLHVYPYEVTKGENDGEDTTTDPTE